MLMVIEGLDGCGKATIAKALKERLQGSMIVDFPRYDTPTGANVKRYLDGELKVNKRQACMLYAMDRMMSMLTDVWYNHHINGGLVIMDRYTTSNILYQGVNDPFMIDFIEGLEYDGMSLPIPDLVFYIDVPVEHTKSDKADIHEKDTQLQINARKSVLSRINRLGWQLIDGMNGDVRKTTDDICDEIIDTMNIYKAWVVW
jgi:dTMP kinase